MNQTINIPLPHSSYLNPFGSQWQTGHDARCVVQNEWYRMTLGSTSWVTDTGGNAVQHLHYLPFGETFINQKTTTFAARYTFSGKEKDTETGYNYFGARYYNSNLSVWLSVDPMSDKYPSWSPYVYCADNPVMLVDPDGRNCSTHTDVNGNVIEVYDDGDLGIYVHNQAEINAYYKGEKFNSNLSNQTGYTLCTTSFSKGDKIDFQSYQAQEWMQKFEAFAKSANANPTLALVYYISEAGNKDMFDPKSKNMSGSQLSAGIYVSSRDLGNFAAGYFGRALGLSKERTLASFGAFQLAKNSKSDFIFHYFSLYKQALSTPQRGSMGQKTYGEDDISNYFQRLGYNNIKTLTDFNNKFNSIWQNQ